MSEDFTFNAGTTTADPDVKPVDDVNILDSLRAEIKRKVARPTISMEVPERPNLTVRFSPNIRQEQIAEWRKRAGDGTKKGMSTTHFSCLIIANTCTGIYLNGEEVLDEAGNPVVFSSETMISMTGTARVVEAIRSVYAVDPHVDMTALKILEAAGYGDDLDAEENPTNT